MKKKMTTLLAMALAASMVLGLPMCTAQAEETEIQFVEDTEYAQEWLEDNEYQMCPGWAVDALSSLYTENEAKFELTYTDQRYAITGAVVSIESDHAMLISADAYGLSMSYYYYVDVYLPKEQLAELTKGYCITVVGDFVAAEVDESADDGFLGAFSEPILQIQNAEIYVPEADTECVVGDTAVSDNFEVTLETAEYVYGASLDTASDDFALPLTEEEYEDVEKGLRVTDEDYSLMSITLTYKYVGDEDVDDFVSTPILYSDYYALTSDAIMFEQCDDGSWTKLGTSMTNSYQSEMGYRDINFSLQSFEAGTESDEVTVRGLIIVPNDVAEDDDPLSLYLTGLDVAFKLQ
ncbi:MAG: hypothetical protein LUG93_09180 [Lachnospiraceae bacterium]|nr:hypothetical protein [Lachnospiraceae bacterium]